MGEAAELVKVIDFEPLITETDGFEMGALNCILENGDVLTLYNVPLDITKAIAKLSRYDEAEIGGGDPRDSIYEILIMVQPRLSEFRDFIHIVVIDGFNRSMGTYSASVYMSVDGINIKRTMIPSHAIFLALLFGKPVYVTEEVVRISKELEAEEGEEEEDFMDYEEDEEEEEEF
ncbi:MAG: bifunctional nuclease family protein [Desulfurococcales archaeon]|nr:bifunctional nuclease family protein [Desulfurococcales archaeon]